jgi:hypothetical protein
VTAADIRARITRALRDQPGRPLRPEEAAGVISALQDSDHAPEWHLVTGGETQLRQDVGELRRAARTEQAGDGFEIWTAPDGIPHLVPVRQDRGAVREPDTGPCLTCGRRHAVLHFRTVRVFGVAGDCRTETGGWPYDCGAKDNHPDHDVYYCRTHGVWWHQAP